MIPRIKWFKRICEVVNVTVPGEVHGLFSSDAEVEVGRVFHLVCVATRLDPVTDLVTVHSVHHVAFVKHTLPIMMGTITWTQSSPFEGF